METEITLTRVKDLEYLTNLEKGVHHILLKIEDKAPLVYLYGGINNGSQNKNKEKEYYIFLKPNVAPETGFMVVSSTSDMLFFERGIISLPIMDYINSYLGTFHGSAEEPNKTYIKHLTEAGLIDRM